MHAGPGYVNCYQIRLERWSADTRWYIEFMNTYEYELKLNASRFPTRDWFTPTTLSFPKNSLRITDIWLLSFQSFFFQLRSFLSSLPTCISFNYIEMKGLFSSLRCQIHGGMFSWLWMSFPFHFDFCVFFLKSGISFIFNVLVDLQIQHRNFRSFVHGIFLLWRIRWNCVYTHCVYRPWTRCNAMYYFFCSLMFTSSRLNGNVTFSWSCEAVCDQMSKAFFRVHDFFHVNISWYFSGIILIVVVKHTEEVLLIYMKPESICLLFAY